MPHRYTYGKTPMFDTRKAREELGIRFLSPEVMLWGRGRAPARAGPG